MRFCTMIFALFIFTACGSTSFRNRLCEPSRKSISSDFDGLFSINTGLGQSSLEIPGFGYASPSFIMVDVEKNLIRAVLPNMPASSSQDQEAEGGFCKIDDQIYLQQYELTTNTWSIFQLNAEQDGFSMQALAFIPEKLAEIGLSYIIIEPYSYFKADSDNNNDTFGDVNIVVNNPPSSSDPDLFRRILKASTKSSIQLRFVRVRPNDKIKNLFKVKGKSFSLGK